MYLTRSLRVDDWPSSNRLWAGKLELNSENLIDDKTTVATLRNLLKSTKPPGIGPVDILHIVRLILSKAEDHPVFDSQQTLAEAFGVDTKTIVRSQKRLVKVGWLSRPARKGRTNALSLNFEQIPAEEPLRLKITPTAKKVAGIYYNALKKRGRKKFHKHWVEQQTPSAQRILDRCGGDLAVVSAILDHALTWPTHKAKSAKGLYVVVGRWEKIMKTYNVVKQNQQQITETKMEAPSPGISK
jgi:hypothetical protein